MVLNTAVSTVTNSFKGTTHTPALYALNIPRNIRLNKLLPFNLPLDSPTRCFRTKISDKFLRPVSWSQPNVPPIFCFYADKCRTIQKGRRERKVIRTEPRYEIFCLVSCHLGDPLNSHNRYHSPTRLTYP